MPLLSQRLMAVLSVSSGTVLLTMDGAIVTIALPGIAHNLYISSSSSVLLVVIYNLAMAMTLLPFASLGERLGLSRLFRLGLLAYMVAAIGAYFANNFIWLIVFRAIQALAASAALSVAIGLVRAIYPPTMLGRGLGLNTVAGVTGAALAPVVAGLLLSVASWRWIFAAAAPLALLSLAFSGSLPRSAGRSEPVDKIGAVLCAATFGLLIAGLESLTQSHHALLSTALLAAGAVTTVVFVRYELGEKHPILPVDLLARPALGLSVGAALSAVLGSTIVMLAIPFRLHELGFSPVEIGALMTPYAIAVGIVSPTAGMLSDHFAPALLGSIGLTIAAFAVLCIAFLPEHPAKYQIAWQMSLCGLGFGLFFSPNARLVIGSAPEDRAASASSLIATTRMFGQASGSTIFGGLLAMGASAGEGCALVAAGLIVVAAVCSVARLGVVFRSQALGSSPGG